MSRRFLSGIALVISFFICVKCEANHPWSSWTALDDYVNRPDPNYGWQQVAEYRRERSTVYCINMTSQMWKDASVHTQPIWWHQLIVAIPDQVDYWDSALLYIGTGSNTDTDPPPETDWRVNASAAFASEMGAVAAYIKQVPNQPLVFTADETSRRRWEDAIIGWTWRRFVMEENGTDPEILLRMPMIKACMRAFDTMANFTQQRDSRFNLTKFLPAGESKRGWTTWMLAAADRRVIGMAPMVLSFMNFQPMLQKYWRSMGGWTFAFADYWREGLTAHIGSTYMNQMADHIDPFSYRDRLTMPKMYIGAAGDEFFPADDSNLFWRELKDPKILSILPNTGHSLRGVRDTIFWNLVNFYHSIVDNTPPPQFSWTYSTDDDARLGTITVTTSTPPVAARVRWSNTTDLVTGRRDFRQRVLNGSGSVVNNPATWYVDPVIDVGNGVITAAYPYPRAEDGWIAFYIELEFVSHTLRTWQLTSETVVIPPTFPYPPCQLEECMGTLL